MDARSSQPLLSVIVPVYKTERYLDECVRSILTQSLTDMEVILVDDESPDGAPAMCDAYAAEDSRVKVIHKRNAGLGHARNTGIDYATGRYVTFVDSDDILDPATFATAVSLMEEHGADMVRYACNRFVDGGGSGPESYDKAPVIFDTPDQLRSLALCIFDIPTPDHNVYDLGGSSCMAVYRMDIIRRFALRFENEREYLSEDYLFNFDYYRHSEKVVWIPRTYYHYRITPGSLTRKVDLNVMARVEKYCRYVSAKFKARDFTPDEQHYATGFYIRALRANMKFVFLSPDLTMAQKRRWFQERTADPYFRERCATYPWRGLPIKQRVLFNTVFNRRFYASYALIVGFSKLRKDKLK